MNPASKTSDQELTPLAPSKVTELQRVNPVEELQFAETVAKTLKSFLDKKPKQVIINNKKYIEFDDWQLIARFFHCTVGVKWTKPLVAKDKIVGYEARATVYDGFQNELSNAEANCTIKEKNWENKDSFQLKSMAQTRACAKAFKNVFAWIVVLAGYQTTPAEEMSKETVIQTSKPETQATPTQAGQKGAGQAGQKGPGTSSSASGGFGPAVETPVPPPTA